MKLPIHFVAIGTELLQGKIQDANGYWLSKYLAKNGYKLSQITMIDDNEHDLEQFFQKQDLTSQFFITSGGLGPTKDDKTKSFFSKLTNSPLENSDKAYDLASDHYKRINKVFTPEQTGYHQIPNSWEPLANPVGLAPGLLKLSTSFNILALPGVPREFQAIINSLELRLFPIQETLYQKLSVRIFGISEEKIFFDIAPNLWKELEELGEVSCLPNFPHLDIGIAGKSLNQDKFKNCINHHLGDLIHSFEMLTIEEMILQELKEKKLTLAIAESCTAGLCSHLLTQISGASQSFVGGIVSYSNTVKTSNLKVKADMIESQGVYSHSVAESMAIGVKEQLEADIGISTTGIAGPGGGSSDNPVGSVYVGVSFGDTHETETRVFHGNRYQLKKYFAYFAFLALLKRLKKST